MQRFCRSMNRRLPLACRAVSAPKIYENLNNLGNLNTPNMKFCTQMKEKRPIESNEITQSDIDNNDQQLTEDEYYEVDEPKKLTPQEELLESWYITLDDRVESLTNHIKGLNRKRTYYVGAGAAFCVGSSSWYQFGLFEMPFEAHLIMVDFPILMCIGHWFYLYKQSKELYSKLTFEQVIDEPYYSDDMRYERKDKPKKEKKPVIIDLIDVNNELSMKTIDEYGQLVDKAKRVAQVSCAISMCAISVLLVGNPLSDPMLTDLETYQFIAYTMYPIVTFGHTLVLHWGYWSNIPLLTDLIKEEMEEERLEKEGEGQGQGQQDSVNDTSTNVANPATSV